MKSIKRGLGVHTNLDWVQTPTEKDTTSSITTNQAISQGKQICELFRQEGIDKEHREQSSSYEIQVNSLADLEEITINNRQAIDTTITLAPNLKGDLLINLLCEGESKWFSSGLTIIVGENTTITLASNMVHTKDAFHVAKQVIKTEKGAKVLWLTQTDGSKQVILDQKSSLEGESSSVHMKTVANTKEGEAVDIANISHHIAPSTTSDIVFRSVVKSAKVLARGLVRIEPKASNSEGYQTSNVLLLDKKARAITIPDLEIENKDVMCSHGSTMSTIDQEKIFYLKSRGIEEETAKEMIVTGFIEDLYTDLSPKLYEALRGSTHEEE